MSAYPHLSAAEREDERRYRRVCYLPLGIERAQAKLLKLEAEAADLGMHDLVTLRNSHLSGDLIATEWLRRLGVL